MMEENIQGYPGFWDEALNQGVEVVERGGQGFCGVAEPRKGKDYEVSSGESSLKYIVSMTEKLSHGISDFSLGQIDTLSSWYIIELEDTYSCNHPFASEKKKRTIFHT